MPSYPDALQSVLDTFDLFPDPSDRTNRLLSYLQLAVGQSAVGPIRYLLPIGRRWGLTSFRDRSIFPIV